MEFDPKRPCGSRTRTKGRYTKDELWKIARKNGIKPEGKSMDDLCELLREKHRQMTEKVLVAEEKAQQASKEEELGGPFASLESGTIEKLKGKLEEPVGGVLLISGTTWKILDGDLKELRSLEVRDSLSNVFMYPSGTRFVGIGDQGVGVWDLYGNLLHLIPETQDVLRGYIHGGTYWAIPMDEDKILYAHMRLGTESLVLYSLAQKTKSVIQTLSSPSSNTHGLFRFTDTKYIRFTRAQVVLGDIVTSTETVFEIKDGLIFSFDVMRLSPTRFLMFGVEFRVVDVRGKLSGSLSQLSISTRLVSRSLRAEVGIPDFYMGCGIVVTENKVLLTEQHPKLVYILDLEKGTAGSLEIRTGDLQMYDMGAFKCALAVAGGKVFLNTFAYRGALLSFDFSKVEGKWRKYRIQDKYVHGARLTQVNRVPVEGQGGTMFQMMTSLITDIKVLEAVRVPTPEYVAAAKATVDLMIEIPKDLQGVVAKFLI